MATEFKLPELGENIKEGDVTSILIKEGDVIKADQPVIEMETGKATVEIPSSVGGKVLKIHVKEGTKAKIGQLILTIEEGAAAPAAKEKPAAEKPAEKPAAKPAEEKAPEPKAEKSEPAKPAAPKTAAPATRSTGSTLNTSSTSVPASPSTRQFAREIGIDINEVEGSGPGGRVSVDDVKQFSRTNRSSGGGGPIAAPLPDFSKWGEVEAESLSNIRAATAQHMAISWSNIPHVTIHDMIDITGIEALRKSAKAKADAAGVKLTLTAFLIKILASALKVHPKFNSSLDLGNNQLILKKYVNIGIAMDTERGLIVPILRNTDSLNVLQVAKELGNLADRAKARKISPEDMQGGSITITNIGGIGGSFFTPIVNFPEVAILGVGRGVVQPVQVDGFFQPRLMLPLSLSFDHRVIDGADGARFLRWIADAIQQPALLSLEG